MEMCVNRDEGEARVWVLDYWWKKLAKEAAFAPHRSSFINLDTLSVVVEINHTIGAEGVLSSKCKEVVSHYGVRICDLLVARVGPSSLHL
ncbi:aspartic proteinase-like isoform X2 [Senna tora]|uniref:Aspartic proteinase-like isoform X2 n=1 Tax=Senna tora TaxID=362788 RepID=A0A834X520_9FABA|nr:aspartic proteinase-like isoform X2 [Senna tora]